MSQPVPPVVWVRAGHLERVRQSKQFQARLASESYLYPSVNIVARVPGTDPTLRNEYLVFSSHQDANGVRVTLEGDSVHAGADDNATVTAAILAAALVRSLGLFI